MKRLKKENSLGECDTIVARHQKEKVFSISGIIVAFHIIVPTYPNSLPSNLPLHTSGNAIIPAQATANSPTLFHPSSISPPTATAAPVEL